MGTEYDSLRSPTLTNPNSAYAFTNFGSDIIDASGATGTVVIVGGLIGVLFICVLLLPTLYVWFARPNDAMREMAMED